MHKHFFRVHLRLIVVFLAIVGVVSSVGSPAQALSWMSFSEGTGGLVSNDGENPTILSRVDVICPETGFLVATSSSYANFHNPAGPKTTGVITFSIAREQRSDLVYSVVALQNMGPNTLASIPANIQRIEACSFGERRTYFHTAHGQIGGPGSTASVAGRPRLVVQFFNRSVFP